jgi:hypothetical protein
VSDDGAHAVVETTDVHANDVIEIFWGGGFDRADMRDSSVVDENVNALLAEDLLESDVHKLLIGHVAEVEGSVAASVGNLLAGCGRRGFVDVQNAKRRALFREPESNGLPDAAATAGDDGEFAIEPEISRGRVLVGQSETPRFQGMKSS